MASKKTSPARSLVRSTPARSSSRSAPRSRSGQRSRTRSAPGTHNSEWGIRIDPSQVALVAVLIALGSCAGLLLDVYLGQTDPVHVAVVTAFGPLAFLVPIGAGLLVVDFYRRHEGQRPWLRFEESCGALLLFIAALTFASLAGLAPSLVGDSLREEIVGLIGTPGTLLAVLTLLAIGAVLAFHITLDQITTTWHQVAHLAAAGPRLLGRGMRRQNSRALAADPATPDGRGARGRKAAVGDESYLSASVAIATPPPTTTPTGAPAAGRIAPDGDDDTPFTVDAQDQQDESEDEPVLAPATPVWPQPQVDLLDTVPVSATVPANNDARARIIEETLASFNVDADVVDVQSGPTVTQFGLRPAAGVRVQRITALSNDLALALSAPSIRIEAPVPGKPVVGIEIPNASTALVTLREILESEPYSRVKSPLKIALGKNVAGEPIVTDLARMPHLLIAGATGSGKSVCLNSLIACLLFYNSPERLRLLMIDPKLVELTTFNGVPHLLHPVVTEMDKVRVTLKWVLKEMHRRYKLFGEVGARNIARYNELLYEREQVGELPGDKDKSLPYIVFIVDELADLMMVSPAEVEDSISRLAALARATGIHLVVATQRPSVDVVTGVIKANFPARIAFAVSSQVDSRTILDQGGAEKLLGRGDMLYLPSDGSKAIRVQGTYLSDQEIERIVEFWQHNTPLPPEQIAPVELEPPKSDEADGESEDKLFSEAVRVVREYRRASVSLLQRRLSIGYSRAARLIDQLEERGIVASSEDGRSRIVLDSAPDDEAGGAATMPDEK